MATLCSKFIAWWFLSSMGIHAYSTLYEADFDCNMACAEPLIVLKN